MRHHTTRTRRSVLRRPGARPPSLPPTCLDILKMVQVLPVEKEIQRFENYYQVLQEDEDYFPVLSQIKGLPRSSKAERKKLFNEAFAQNLQMEAVCYFKELEEHVEGVFGTLALRMANLLTSKLHVRYPVETGRRFGRSVGVLSLFRSCCSTHKGTH